MGKFLVLLMWAALAVGCSASVEVETPEACSDQYNACAAAFTGSVSCLDGSCTCSIAAQGEGVFFDCRTLAADGLHNRSLGLP